MNLRKAITRYADVHQLAAAILIAVTLVVLYVLTTPVATQRHYTLLSYFNQLERDEGRLGEAILQLNFSLSNHYDHVNMLMARMRAVVNELRAGEAATDLRKLDEFQHQLRLLETKLTAMTEALETFKSRNAALKNSLIYMLHARDDLLKELPRASAIGDQVNKLVEQVLLNRSSTRSEHSQLEAAIVALQNEVAKLPANVQRKATIFLRHVRLIDQYEHEMPKLVQQLVGQNDVAVLREIYQGYYDRQQKRTVFFRFFLLITTLLLLAYALVAMYRISAQSERLKLASSVFASAAEGIIITDPNGTILEVNKAFVAITGYTRKEIIGKNPRILQSGRQDAKFYAQMWKSLKDTGRWQGEIWNRRKNGEIYPEWLTISACTEQKGPEKRVTHYVAVFTDITQRKKSEERILRLAFLDPLTNLPNRRLFMKRLQRILAMRDRDFGFAALLFIDLDNFKTLNDTKGHQVGDLFLVEVAQRLQSSVRKGDMVARLGGDEFVVMLEGLGTEPDRAANVAELVGEKIRHALNQPYRLNDFEFDTSCSIGITLFRPGVGADEVLKQADTAMYQAKAAGRNALRFFDPAMQAELEARTALEADLRKALDKQEFVLLFQPQVDADGRLLGAEVLLRWNHPKRGMVPPAEFIPLAEETGLIVPIGQWVLASACAQLKAWEARPESRHLTLAVNVSARQFAAGNFVDHVESVIARSSIDPSRLKLEITESLLLRNADDTIHTLRQLSALGVRLSIDDFGTGYSSLQYLKRLPLEQIKIDRSFVRDLTTDRNDQVIVRAIIAMAKNLELDVVAEGVENEEQKQFLIAAGCRCFQGYLFGKPVPLAQFQELFKLA